MIKDHTICVMNGPTSVSFLEKIPFFFSTFHHQPVVLPSFTHYITRDHHRDQQEVRGKDVENRIEGRSVNYLIW